MFLIKAKDMVSRDPKSGHKFKFSGGLIWIVLHYPKREQSLFIYLFLEMVHNTANSYTWTSYALWADFFGTTKKIDR